MIRLEACNNRRLKPTGIADLTINLSGKPPGSGEPSRTLKLLMTKGTDEFIITIQNGIRKIMVPIRLTHALPFAEY